MELPDNQERESRKGLEPKTRRPGVSRYVHDCPSRGSLLSVSTPIDGPVSKVRLIVRTDHFISLSGPSLESWSKTETSCVR